MDRFTLPTMHVRRYTEFSKNRPRSLATPLLGEPTLVVRGSRFLRIGGKSRMHSKHPEHLSISPQIQDGLRDAEEKAGVDGN